VPGTKGLPVFLTECDIDWGTGTSIYNNPNLNYRNSEYFAAFQCAMIRRMLDLRDEFPDNPIEATFLDTFYIPGYRIFEGQRTLITGDCLDIEKPILNALRVLGKLGEKRLIVTEQENALVKALATAREDGSIQVMAVNFKEEFGYDQTVAVQIELQGLQTGSWSCLHYRIDRDHSNAYTVWQVMGRPLIPDSEQLAMIRRRQGLELAEPEFTIASSDEKALIQTTMPPQSISLWIIVES